MFYRAPNRNNAANVAKDFVINRSGTFKVGLRSPKLLPKSVCEDLEQIATRRAVQAPVGFMRCSLCTV
jgi:hypothetical protein